MQVRDLTKGVTVQFGNDGFEIVREVSKSANGYNVWFNSGRYLPCKGHESLDSMTCQSRYQSMYGKPSGRIQRYGQFGSSI